MSPIKSPPLIVPLSPSKPLTYADSIKETEDRLRSRFEQLKALARTSMVREEFRKVFEAATASTPRSEPPLAPPSASPPQSEAEPLKQEQPLSVTPQSPVR
jgi:hypothetical protein